MKMLVSNDTDLAEFIRRIKLFPIKRTHIASFVVNRKTRSLNQSRYYWACLQCASKETGNTVDDLHEYFKGKYLSKSTKEMFGTMIVTHPSTTTLDTAQFTIYLDKIKAEMLEYSIYLPDPGSQGFDQFMTQYET